MRQLESVLRRYPSRVAVVAGSTQLTYAELEESSRELGARVALHHLPEDALLILHLGRTIELLVGIVAALRIGRPYTVVEPDENAACEIRRLVSLGPALVISEQSEAFDSARTIEPTGVVEELPVSESAGEEIPDSAIAYVLFTSGSTGKPKGVAVTHANVGHYAESVSRRLGLSEGLVYAHVSTFKADLGNTSLFLSLLTAGTLHIVSDGCRKNPELLAAYLVANGVDFLKITPSQWSLLVHTTVSRRPFCLEYLVLGGERLTSALAKATLDSGLAVRVINHYGPTETTIGVLAHVLGKDDLLETNSQSVPIGTPFGDTRILIQRADGVLCNGAATGELLIGGSLVAAGYFKDPESTSKAFVTSLPGCPGARFYRSGDLVVRDDTGRVTFLGRRDRQIKVRGYRVELDHVECTLRALPGIRDVRVGVGSASHAQYLVALLVREPELSAGTHVELDEACQPTMLGSQERAGLRNALREALPEYMIPQHYFAVRQFELNANGKVDVTKADALLKQFFAGYIEATLNSEVSSRESFDKAMKDVMDVWRERLLVREIAPRDDFFALGGNSIDAILMIADLQRKGYCVSASQFLQQPTVEALVGFIRSGAHAGLATQSARPRHESELLSPAQNWFFRRDFPDADHWNQALAFECSVEVNAHLLATSLARVLDLHPMLETRFLQRGKGWHAERVPGCGTDCLSVSRERSGSPNVAAVAQRLHRAIRIAEGKVFKVHLFKCESGRDRLLIIAHHLTVDLVSWRILLDDLTRLYNAAVVGTQAEMPGMRQSYWDWVHHMRLHRDRLLAQSSHWERMMTKRLASVDETGSELSAGRNQERDSQLVWFILSATEFRRVTDWAGGKWGCGPAETLLGVFLQERSRAQNCTEQWVEVESHGRLTYGNFDVSRTVGWFTSAFPLLVDCVSDGDVEHAIRSTATTLASVPDLGAGYLLYLETLAHQRSMELADFELRLCPSICFNYLGNLTVGATGALTLSPSRVPIGAARAEANSRVHDLKLTARMVEGSLIVDLGFSRNRYGISEMRDLIRRVQDRLLRIGGCARRSAASRGTLEGSATGLLCFVPPQVTSKLEARPRHNQYRRVLLTGATGFLGCHLLEALLRRAEAEIVCVVRRGGAGPARTRLRETFIDYFGGSLADSFETQCRVIESDSRPEDFGLPPEAFDDLARSCDAVFHFAADTRLFANPGEVTHTNIAGTEAAIRFATSGRPKHLHYMSTLAVAGINPRPDVIPFSERDLDVGQQFQNAYEGSKYQCEKLVRAHMSRGGTAYVYRAGNVSGHSRTGRFSRAGGGNRIVQMLQAIVELGQAPLSTTEQIAMTPVNDVINGCLILAADPELAGGVYHLDNGKLIDWTEILTALLAQGASLKPSGADSIRSLFGSPVTGESPGITVGRLWANRPDRNVLFDCRYTQRLLSRQGFSYGATDLRWLEHLLGDFRERGFLSAGGSVHIKHCTQERTETRTETRISD